MRRGKVGPHISKLIKELRATMYPYTAINLKESNVNTLRDFMSIVDVYGLSHMVILTNTDKASYLKLGKLPRGPTATFKISDYTLAGDIFDHIESLKKQNPKPLNRSFNHVPLVIMNGFKNKNVAPEYVEPVEIVSMLLQSFFPPLNLNSIQLKKCKRVVLFNLNINENNIPEIEFRHFDIDIEKYSLKKTIANIINNKTHDLSKFNNISDYILKHSGYTSQSDNDEPDLGVCDVINDNDIAEAMKEEKPEEEKNEKEKEKKKKLIEDNKVKVRLTEMGPRLTLQVHKIVEGFLKGNVLFHSYMNKSKKEIKETMDKLREKRKLKNQRKTEQTKNVKVKKEEEDSKLTDYQKQQIERSK